MIDMTKKDILPAGSAYAKQLADTIVLKKSAGGADASYEEDLLKKISSLTGCIYSKVQQLEKDVVNAKAISDTSELALYYRNTVFAAMNELRANVDELEGYVPKSQWPLPSYGDLLFSVR